MKTVPSLAGQVAAKGGEPYKILLDTAQEADQSFATNNLAPNQTRQFQIPLNKAVSLYINGIVASLNSAIALRTNPVVFAATAPEGLFFNVWDSRNLTRWFIPDPQPLNTGAGGAAARNAYRPAPFHVPNGQNLIVEFLNTHTAALAVDFRMVFTGTLAQIGSGRQ